MLYGALSLGAALPQFGAFLSAASSAADVFNVIDEVIVLIPHFKGIRLHYQG